MKNGKEKTTIMVSTRPGLDSRGWFEEKSNRILEELSFLADILHRNAMKIASISGETERPFTAEDIDRIIDGGHKGYLEYREGRQS